MGYGHSAGIGFVTEVTVVITGREDEHFYRILFRVLDELPLFDRYIAVYRRILYPLDLAARFRPDNLDPIDFPGVSGAQDFAWIVRRQVTSSAIFQSRPHHATGLPADPGPDRIAIAIHAF